MACQTCKRLVGMINYIIPVAGLTFEEVWGENMDNEVKSTHKCEVVPVTMTKHPNADSLSIIPIFGYTYCGRTEDWQGISKAAWCPPDSLVDTTLPEFAFLAGEAKFYEDSYRANQVSRKEAPKYARIRAKKLRGVVSYGLLIPVEDSVELGTDLAERFGVLHYDPPVNTGNNNQKQGWYTGGETCKPPEVYSPKYDVDSFQRYAKDVFVDGEPVWVTEKIHGASGRWVYHDGEMYCGSRAEWKRQYTIIPVPDREELKTKLFERVQKVFIPEERDRLVSNIDSEADKIIENINKKNAHPEENLWWRALRSHPEVRQWCEEHPDTVLYGEVYGAVQNLKYGVPNGQVRIAIFDILNKGTWTDPLAARVAGPNLPWVPLISNNFVYQFDNLVTLAEGNSLVPGAEGQIREGIVVKPMQERQHPYVGRVQLKIVSSKYLDKDY